jgi:hypothetical protein
MTGRCLLTWSIPFLSLGLVMGTANAAEAPHDTTQSFEEAAQLVEQGTFSEALLRFERLSDRGFVHPDASFNRGLAYLQRADSAQVKPGDWGQAIAGFREAVVLADDEEAERLVDTVRQVISRQRAARGRDPVVVSPPLGRALSELVRPSTWAILALAASGLLSIALVVRRYATAATRLTANVTAATSLGLLGLFAGLFAVSDHYQRVWQEAVIVVEQATLRDAQGKPLLTRALDTNSADVPEGASVYVLSRAGRLVEVQWGSSKAWLRDGELRMLAAP